MKNWARGEDYDKFDCSFEDKYLGMDDRLQKVRWSRQRQNPEETYWSKPENYEVYFGVQELPRAAHSSV